MPEEGEYRLRLTSSDGSLSSTLDIELTVRSDLEGITAPVGEPLVNDAFDWGTANRSNAQLPPGSGWVFGTNNFSYVANADGTWSGSGKQPLHRPRDVRPKAVQIRVVGSSTIRAGVHQPQTSPRDRRSNRWVTAACAPQLGFNTIKPAQRPPSSPWAAVTIYVLVAH